MRELTDREMYLRSLRIMRLVEAPRMMSIRAAVTVVDAAMFGIGCVEGTVRAEIQKRIEAENEGLDGTRER
jgi:hypothetical protein